MKKAAPHPVLQLVTLVQQVADDPDQGEGMLRDSLRRAADILGKQHAIIERQRRDLVWRFGGLAVAFGLLAGGQLARTFGWL